MKKRLLILLFVLFGVFPLLASCSDGNELPPESNNVETDSDRKIYYNVNYTIESENVSNIKNSISKKVREFDGYIFNSVDNEELSRYVYRVPTKRVNEFLDYVDSYDDYVIDKTIESTDITTKYSQIQARISILEASKEAYLKVLNDQTLSLSEIMSIREKIEDIDAELLVIYNKLASMDSQIDYSTITITYEDDPKFFSTYGDYLKSTGEFIYRAFFYILPYGLVVALIISLINLPTYIRKRKARNNTK
jgi:hypothetical protein